MTEDDIEQIVRQFEGAAKASLKAGFRVLEIHMAHGYLLHEILSPLSNFRKDQYGGSLENRMRLPLKIAKTLRSVWPISRPVFTRISASDWVEGGWDLKQSIEFSKKLKEIGIDLIDCSSGGNVPDAPIPAVPGYQVPFSAGIRKEAAILTGAVGIITDPHQCEKILDEGKADVIFMAREFLRDPYFPLHGAKILGEDIKWPQQYDRAKR